MFRDKIHLCIEKRALAAYWLASLWIIWGETHTSDVNGDGWNFSGASEWKEVADIDDLSTWWNTMTRFRVRVSQLLLVITDLWLIISVADWNTETLSFLGSVLCYLRVVSTLHNSQPQTHAVLLLKCVSVRSFSAILFSRGAPLPAIMSNYFGHKTVFVLPSASQDFYSFCTFYTVIHSF